MSAEKQSPPRKSFWGYGIAIVYSVFALATIGFAAFTMTQKVDLVAPDYYAQEISYEQQIQRLRNTTEIERQVKCELVGDGRVIEVSFPAALKNISGTLTLYRPSSSALDREVRLAPDASGQQRIPADKLQSGFWRAKLLWQADGQEYFREFMLHIQ